jgi:predicted Fe-S protein YdhL (DUF1289 family)
MSNAAEYFAKNRPTPKFFLGDRVYGYHKKKLWVGTVLIDNMVSAVEGPCVRVCLDLPLRDGKEVLTWLKIPNGRGIKYLVPLEEEEVEKKTKKIEKKTKVAAQDV